MLLWYRQCESHEQPKMQKPDMIEVNDAKLLPCR
jgi:hypothetical protein